MTRFTTALVISLGMLLASAATASATGPDTILLGQVEWQEFAVPGHEASLAWSGEDESNAASASLLTLAGDLADAEAVDVALLTGLPAPEPPAIVLAGLAFGGVLCGRSLLRRKKATEPVVDETA